MDELLGADWPVCCRTPVCWNSLPRSLDDADLLRDEMARVYRNAVYHAALREAAATVRQGEGQTRDLRLGIGE